jgi:hypothetical protein
VKHFSIKTFFLKLFLYRKMKRENKKRNTKKKIEKERKLEKNRKSRLTRSAHTTRGCVAWCRCRPGGHIGTALIGSEGSLRLQSFHVGRSKYNPTKGTTSLLFFSFHFRFKKLFRLKNDIKNI